MRMRQPCEARGTTPFPAQIPCPRNVRATSARGFGVLVARCANRFQRVLAAARYSASLPATTRRWKTCSGYAGSSAATASPNAPVLIGNLRAPIARPHRRFTAHRDLCAANNKKQAHRPARNARKDGPALSSSMPSQTAQPFPAAPQSIRAAPSNQRAPPQKGGSAAPVAASARPSVP